MSGFVNRTARFGDALFDFWSLAVGIGIVEFLAYRTDPEVGQLLGEIGKTVGDGVKIVLHQNAKLFRSATPAPYRRIVAICSRPLAAESLTEPPNGLGVDRRG
jgi:hypothetical protein